MGQWTTQTDFGCQRFLGVCPQWMMQSLVALAILEFDILISGSFLGTLGAEPLLDRPVAFTLEALFDH